jgi:hypothetical protein
MAEKGIKFVATGIPETVAAFDRFADMDLEKAEDKAAKAILPTVKANTRHDTGSMQGAWNVEGGKFVNEQDYASYQEFGTRFVPAAFAVQRAWDEKQSEVEKAFTEVIEHAASQAGLDT